MSFFQLDFVFDFHNLCHYYSVPIKSSCYILCLNLETYFFFVFRVTQVGLVRVFDPTVTFIWFPKISRVIKALSLRLFICNLCREKVRVPVTKPYVSFIGKTNQTASPVITWNSKSSDIGPNGTALGTYASATVGVDSNYFCATGVTFEVRTQFLVTWISLHSLFNTFNNSELLDED